MPFGPSEHGSVRWYVASGIASGKAVQDTVELPLPIADYRVGMRFVDTNDQRSSSYMLRSSWHKWWQVLFWDALLDAMTVNAHMLYNATCNKGESAMEQRGYREDLIRALLTTDDGTTFTSRKQAPQRPQPLTPQTIDKKVSRRKRAIGHYSVTTDKGRCMCSTGCARFTRYACGTCEQRCAPEHMEVMHEPQ